MPDITALIVEAKEYDALFFDNHGEHTLAGSLADALEVVTRERNDALRTQIEVDAPRLAETERERDRYRDACLDARDELGVPGDGYPAPVANAVEKLNAALDV